MRSFTSYQAVANVWMGESHDEIDPALLVDFFPAGHWATAVTAGLFPAHDWDD